MVEIEKDPFNGFHLFTVRVEKRKGVQYQIRLQSWRQVKSGGYFPIQKVTSFV